MRGTTSKRSSEGDSHDGQSGNQAGSSRRQARRQAGPPRRQAGRQAGPPRRQARQELGQTALPAAGLLGRLQNLGPSTAGKSTGRLVLTRGGEPSPPLVLEL